MTSKRLARLCSLDACKPLELALAHLHSLFAKADLARRALDKRHTVRVQALVDRAHAGLGPRHLHALGCARDLLLQLRLVSLAQVLDHRCLHGKLDHVKRQEPHNIPHPDNAEPTSGDAVNLGEGPVGVDSDERREELCEAKSTEERVRGHLHEEEAVRTCDEDECLRDDGHLEVDNHVQLWVVGVLGFGKRGIEVNAKVILEEVGLKNDNDQRDPECTKCVISIVLAGVREYNTGCETYVETVR